MPHIALTQRTATHARLGSHTVDLNSAATLRRDLMLAEIPRGFALGAASQAGVVSGGKLGS